MANYNMPEDNRIEKYLQQHGDQIERLSRASNKVLPTVITTNYVVLETDDWIINDKTAAACILTLLDPTEYAGYYIKILTYRAFGVTSASANVVPITGGAAGTVIITTTAGKFVEMISDGVNWLIIRAN